MIATVNRSGHQLYQRRGQRADHFCATAATEQDHAPDRLIALPPPLRYLYQGLPGHDGVKIEGVGRKFQAPSIFIIALPNSYWHRSVA
jgi:hypothetical protein